jgi:hypothetical protein
VNGFLNSVWLRKFNSFSSLIKGSKQSYKYNGLYACELWDGCTILDFKKIEQIQHEAARIVTGLPKFAINIKDYHYYVFCRTSLILYYVYENGGVPTQFQNIGILCLQILAPQ